MIHPLYKSWGKKDIASRLYNHVWSAGGPAKDADGAYIGTAWPMMLEASEILNRRWWHIAALYGVIIVLIGVCFL